MALEITQGALIRASKSVDSLKVQVKVAEKRVATTSMEYAELVTKYSSLVVAWKGKMTRRKEFLGYYNLASDTHLGYVTREHGS